VRFPGGRDQREKARASRSFSQGRRALHAVTRSLVPLAQRLLLAE
jgi:hypothetical protein